MSVLGRFHYFFVVVVVEYEVKVVEQNLAEAAGCLMEIGGKDDWAQGQVELEGFLGYSLFSILETKYGDTV
jgi:hypothetical protein